MKKIIYMILVLSVMGVFLYGCSNKSDESTSESKKIIDLYFRSVDNDEYVTVPYQLISNEPEACVKDVMKQLLDRSQKVEDGYTSPAPDGLMINSVKFDQSQFNIDFNEVYHNMTGTEEMFFRSCVVMSLTQIDGVNSVDFMINGEQLMNYSGDIIGPMHDHDFLIEGFHGTIYTDTKTVTLYFATKDGKHLVEVEKNITNQIGDSMEKTAIIALTEEVDTKESYVSPIPKDVKVNSITINGGTCYIDLSEDILDPIPGVNSKTTVFAMVNTLINMSGVSNVSFTVNGESIKTLNDYEGFSSFIGFDYQIVKGQNETVK